MMRRRALLFAAALFGTALLGAPGASAAPASDWKTVDPGTHHTCGTRGVGLLFCWGRNNVGQVGDGTSGNIRVVPKRITAVSDWKVVTGGYAHTCGIRGTGALYCWGDNNSGQIGDGTIASERLSPKRITLVSDWKTVSGGFIHTCGIRGTGALYCWGNNTYGQLGDGTDDARLTPKRVGTLSDWKTVTAGTNHTCGIRGTGVLYCWGDNASGQVGDGTQANTRLAPKKITAVVDWKRTSAGGAHTCGIRGTGALYCWGDNNFGQIGDGTSGAGSNRLTPKRIGTLADWTTAGIGGLASCGIRGTGTLYCWGDNTTGQVGDGTSSNNRPSPTKITAVVDWKAAATGGSHTCGIRGTGALYCWGFNFDGQVGNGTFNNGLFSPVRI